MGGEGEGCVQGIVSEGERASGGVRVRGVCEVSDILLSTRNALTCRHKVTQELLAWLPARQRETDQLI